MEVVVTHQRRTPEFPTAPIRAQPGDPFNYVFHYASAPTSPTRAADLYHHFSLPETSPLNPRDTELLDFTFDSGAWSNISTADELFEEGRIRLLDPPPSDPFSATARDRERGRQRTTPSSISGNAARESRSLSPLRDRRYFFEKTSSSSTAAPAAGGGRKWRLRDLLLFRSASEGRVTGRGSKDPLWKYTLLSSFSPFSTSTSRKKGEEGSSCRSFGSKEGSGGGSSERRGGPTTSAHEIHYAAYRAAAEEQRKKTPLPFKPHALFGCLRFNPAIRNIGKGLSGHSSRGR